MRFALPIALVVVGIVISLYKLLPGDCVNSLQARIPRLRLLTALLSAVLIFSGAYEVINKKIKDYKEALKKHEEALKIAEKLDSPSEKANSLNNIGEIYQMINQSIKDGMRTIEQDLVKLFMDKKISLSTALNYSNNKRRIEQILKMSNQAAR